MTQTPASPAQAIAKAALDFQRRNTGHEADAALVVLGARTLFVTLQNALTPAEKLQAGTPGGADRVREFHRRLFARTAGPLRAEIERLTGVTIGGDPGAGGPARAGADAPPGVVLHAFPCGTVVQVFELARARRHGSKRNDPDDDDGGGTEVWREPGAETAHRN